MKLKNYLLIGFAGLISLVKIANGQNVQNSSSNMDYNKNNIEVIKSSNEQSNVAQYSNYSSPDKFKLEITPDTTNNYFSDSTITQKIEFNENNKNTTAITENQARTIDSTLVADNLTNGNFHTDNYHEPGVFTWDAGNGLYTPIPGYSVAWSHVGKVDQTTAEQINSQNGQSYRLFDLDNMANTQAYRDSVETWMSQIGIPVDVKEHENIETKLFPNPLTSNTKLQANVPAGEDYQVVISNTLGQVIGQYEGKTNQNGLDLPMKEMENLSKGTYVFTLINKTNNYSISMKGVKQ